MTQREALIQRLRNLAGMIPHKHTLPSGADTVICSLEAFMQIKELADEAADVLEVTHAEWVAENSRPKSGVFYCSNCHRTCYDPQPTRAKGWTKRCRYHYCPNCGAKMDGGQDDV